MSRLAAYLEAEHLFERNSNIPAANQHGVCYETAMNYMISHRNDNILLCHGMPTGQGPIAGIIYNHAWVEKGNKVIDDTIPIVIPKATYYAVGKIKERDVFRYTYEQMTEKVQDLHTYGPWENKLLANKY